MANNQQWCDACALVLDAALSESGPLSSIGLSCKSGDHVALSAVRCIVVCAEQSLQQGEDSTGFEAWKKRMAAVLLWVPASVR